MNHTTPYRHGGQLHAIAEQFGLPVSSLLDFSANINPDGPPASVITALEKAIRNTDNLTHYPDLDERLLKKALGVYTCTSETRVLVDNGFVAILDATVRALNIRTCLLPVPSFVEYRRVLERNGVAISPVVLRQEDNFRYDIDQLLAGHHDAILIANPQNPSGVLCEKNILLELVTRAAERGTYILLDEAFIDYAPEHSLTSAVVSFPNLIIFRSLTKCFGVPGLRVAYAIAHETVRSKIEGFLSPWSISVLASQTIIAAIEDTEFIQRFRPVNERRRSKLATNLASIGVAFYPAVANYLLLRFPTELDTSALWADLVAKNGIVLRSCENFQGLSRNHLRTSVQNEAANQTLVNALCIALSKTDGRQT